MARNPRKPKVMSKKHLARVERERRQTRMLLIGSGVVIVLVLLTVLYGVLDQTVLKQRRAVAIVNGEKITTATFQAQTRYYRFSLIRNAQNTYQFAQFLAADPSSAASFASQLLQYQAMLNPTTAGEQVINRLVEDALIRQEAARLGITVTDEEVEEAFQRAFGYTPNGTPTPTATLPPIPTSTLSPLQLTLIPPTATATITPTVTSTPTLTPTATLPPTETLLPSATAEISQAITATLGLTPTETATPTASPTPSATPTETPLPTPTATLTPTATATVTPIPSITPTPTEYTFQAYQTLVADTVKNFQSNYQITEDDLRYVVRMQLLREKVMAAILGDLQPVEEQVWAAHILVDDEQTARDIRDRLNKGEDWYTLAVTYSKDESNKYQGGNLGWFGRGKMVKEFEDAAFQLNVGDTSQPVQTQFGWHIIRILGHENRPISANQFEQLKQQKFQEWLDQKREASQVEIKDFWTEVVPNTPTLPDEILQYISQFQGGSTP